jgi:hypothetical protein
MKRYVRIKITEGGNFPEIRGELVKVGFSHMRTDYSFRLYGSIAFHDTTSIMEINGVESVEFITRAEVTGEDIIR